MRFIVFICLQIILIIWEAENKLRKKMLLLFFILLFLKQTELEYKQNVLLDWLISSHHNDFKWDLNMFYVQEL